MDVLCQAPVPRGQGTTGTSDAGPGRTLEQPLLQNPVGPPIDVALEATDEPREPHHPLRPLHPTHAGQVVGEHPRRLSGEDDRLGRVALGQQPLHEVGDGVGVGVLRDDDGGHDGLLCYGAQGAPLVGAVGSEPTTPKLTAGRRTSRRRPVRAVPAP